jgi:predicted GH43/DUF377 family glycosyl hydrolase
MIPRISTQLLIRPEDVPPSHEDMEVVGAFNPGAVRHGSDVVLLVRVAERPRERRPGWTALPRWTPGEGAVIDWVRDEELEVLDPRVVRRRSDKLVRLTFVSHFRVATSRNGRIVDCIEPPQFVPELPEEEFGIEDARITPIEGRYYITYVAVSRHGAATALASTEDFRQFTRHGVIFCPENKDVVLFPERIDGEYAALHRPNGATQFTRPEMWVARSPDLIHWGKHEHLFAGQEAWASGRIGAGTPPLALDEGWLEIYHGNRRPTAPGKVGTYSAAVMLLARDDPARVLRIGREAVMEPELDFEREGFVHNVVFPTGVVEEHDRLLVYYGASDTYTGVVELSRADLMGTLAG